MASIWIWNSMACRRRSASDTFEENGIHIIQSHLKKNGHNVHIIDWATNTGYRYLSPYFLRKVNRFLSKIIFKQLSNNKKISKPLGLISISIQYLLNFVQNQRMKYKLTAIAKEIKKNNIHFLGIKVWYGEAFTWSKYLTLQVVKYSPQTVVIAGGYHATLYEEDILTYSNFDLAIIKEGEYTLNKLLTLSDELKQDTWSKQFFLNSLTNKIESSSGFSGLIYRTNGLNIKLPYNSSSKEIEIGKSLPTYTRNNGKVKVHILLESLGCQWNKCNFCVHNQFVPLYKKRTIDDLIFEIKAMIQQEIGLFRFTGSDTPPDFGKAIGNAILGNNLHIEFTMGSRAIKNSMKPSVYAEIVDSYTTLITSGLRGVFMGGETGNDIINNAIMNKGLVTQDIIYTIKAIREAQIKTGINISISLGIIHPTPLIDSITIEQVVQDTIELINLSQPDSVMVTPPCPFKNSTWYKNSKQFRFDLNDSFIPEMMEYEYVLYKPLTMWPDLSIKLNNHTFKECVQQSQNLRKIIESELSIPTDLSDEHFLMLRCAGLYNTKGIATFKIESIVDIISSDYSYIDSISQKVNDYSLNLAKSNFL